MKKIAILQSNYIPWKGYFDIINLVDEFILYDDMQFTRRDWRNRNKIKTPDGLKWLTIPVISKGKFDQKINETQVSNTKWCQSHWHAITLNYGKAPYFRAYADRIHSIYQACESETYLSRINYRFLSEICGILGIQTTISWSSDYELADGKTERLVGLVQSAGGDAYLSGPAAKDYIVDACFENAGIALEYMDYDGYPEYPQLFGAYQPQVSILDLIFNTGPQAKEYMKSFGR